MNKFQNNSTKFIIHQKFYRIFFFEIFYGISEAATRENLTSENVNENSIGENVGKMNENFKEKQTAFWNEMKKMSPF